MLLSEQQIANNVPNLSVLNSLPGSKQRATGIHPEPLEGSPRNSVLFLEDSF